jgi:Zn-dependent protease with chaperone function
MKKVKIVEKNILARQILGIISIVGVIANALLFAFRVYGMTVFWIVIIIFAIIAFPVMNWLKK